MVLKNIQYETDRAPGMITDIQYLLNKMLNEVLALSLISGNCPYFSNPYSVGSSVVTFLQFPYFLKLGLGLGVPE